MKLHESKRDLLIIQICMLLILLALLIQFGVYGYDKVCLFLMFGLALLSFHIIRTIIGNIFTVTMFFILFWMLYTFSAPISIIYGEGINQYFFPQPYYISTYFIFSSISIVAFVLGFSKRTSIYNLQQPGKAAWTDININCLGFTAIIFAILVSLTEIVNYVRIGGLSTALQGKAAYQSAVSDLFLTLPSKIISFAAFGIIGAYVSYIKGRSLLGDKKLLLFILILLPYILLQILVGFRGVLLGGLLIFVIGYNYNRVIPNLRIRFILGILAVYIIMVLISSARGISSDYIQSGDYKSLIYSMLSEERIQKYINPANNEYGVAFGNFNLYYQFNKGNNEYKLGRTYWNGLMTVVPSFLYPGKKPQTINYEFRDKYMPFEIKRGSIASHGFSFMLEAYINYGIIGIILIYFLIGRMFFILEYRKTSKNSFVFMIYYISCIATLTTFHRSHFGDFFSNSFTLLMLIVFSRAVYNVIYGLSNRTPSKCRNTPLRQLSITDKL